jgi:hypothetical protein
MGALPVNLIVVFAPSYPRRAAQALSISYTARLDKEQADGTFVFLREDNAMTLARGNIGGYEFDRMVLLFSMMDGTREIPCAVSASAMDELEHVSRTAPDQREEQFLRLRDRIEQCASRKFDAGEFEGTPPGIILRSIDFRG